MNSSDKLRPGMRVARSCPMCGEGMVVRRNSRDGSWFLGCAAYPDCRATQELPTDMILRLAGQRPLWPKRNDG